MYIYLILLLIISSLAYDRNLAVKYAYKYYNKTNHDCSKGRYKCTPYPYYGSDLCKYGEGPGDSANFVSQCIVEGGHPPLKGRNCGGICDKIEPGVRQLGICLVSNFHWKRTCGRLLPPPNYIKKGDVVIFHTNNCDDSKAHTVLVTVGGKNAKVTGHSNSVKDMDYKFWGKTKPYFEWLHFDK